VSKVLYKTAVYLRQRNSSNAIVTLTNTHYLPYVHLQATSRSLTLDWPKSWTPTFAMVVQNSMNFQGIQAHSDTWHQRLHEVNRTT
jgi:hypothetical protein